jgi:hypothetical protein
MEREFKLHDIVETTEIAMCDNPDGGLLNLILNPGMVGTIIDIQDELYVIELETNNIIIVLTEDQFKLRRNT